MYTITQPNPYFKCVIDAETKRTMARFNPRIPDELIQEWIELLKQVESLEIRMQAFNLGSKHPIPTPIEPTPPKTLSEY